MDSTIASLVAAVAAHAPSLSAMAGLLMAFALHATLLLAFVWALERAGALKHPGWAEFAWRLALCREPTSDELSKIKAFVREESLEQACRVILNLNEFVYPE